MTLPSVVIGNIVSKLTADIRAPIANDIVLLLVLFATFTILRAVIHITLHNVMPGVEVALRYEQIRHTLRTPIDDSDKKFTAELNATMGRGAKAAGDLIKITFADYMPALLQLVIAAILAVIIEPIVGALMFASGIVSFLITRAQLRSQDGVRVGIARKKSHLDGSMTELLRGKAIVRTLNAVDVESERVHEESRALSMVERRHHRAMGIFDAGKAAVEGIFGVGVVLIGVYLVVAGASAGTVLTLYLLYTQFSMPLRDIHRMRDEANEAGVQLRQAVEILRKDLDPYFERRSGNPEHQAQSAIALKDVSIKYSDKVVAAADVSFEISEGQFYGLCGPAGSGKTSVMKAIAGLLPVASGEIRLFGRPFSDVGAQEFSDKIDVRAAVLSSSISAPKPHSD